MIGRIAKIAEAAAGLLPKREMELETALSRLLAALPRCSCGKVAIYARSKKCATCFDPKTKALPSPSMPLVAEAEGLVRAALDARARMVTFVPMRDPALRELAANLVGALPRCMTGCGELGQALELGMWLCPEHARESFAQTGPAALNAAAEVRAVEEILSR